MAVRVLHVVATRQRRGAELFASGLIQALHGLGVAQEVALLRATGPSEVEFHAPTSQLARGPRLPGGLDPIAVRDLRAIRRRFRPTVVQAHGGEALKIAVMGSGGVPVVYRRIGEAPPWLLSGPRRWLYAQLVRRAAAVVVVADALRRQTIDLFGARDSRVITIPNAVDPCSVQMRQPREATREALGIGPDAVVTATVGALVPEKDPLAVLEMLAPVLDHNPEAVHLFVGDGPLRRDTEMLAREHLAADRVRFLGVRDDVGDVLRASDVLVFGGRPGGMEGMPGILIEAGMCGLPVVGADVAGVREVVEDEVTGSLWPPGDVAIAREQLARLMVDPALRHSMGVAASQRCKGFSLKEIAPRYLSVYEWVVRR